MHFSTVFCGIFCMLVVCCFTYGQTTNVVVLNEEECSRLSAVLKESERAAALYDSIAALAANALSSTPAPLEVIYYEGLLDTNPKRVQSMKSLREVDDMVALIYAGYGREDRSAIEAKVKEMILGWAGTYIPTGNTINENKFCPFFWAYYLYRDAFTSAERSKAEDWIRTIATMQMRRPHTPNNNWQAKRLRIIGIAGCVLEDGEMRRFAVDGIMKYIASAYRPDGTSRDLEQRDALHYHVSGLKPMLAACINLSGFDAAFDLYSYESDAGSSLEKSVQYVVPYATGQLKRKEWVNSTVELDRRRAAAGIDKYQPGMLFKPEKAIPLFEWACYYNTDWYALIDGEGRYDSTWVGLLNSPWIRK